MDRRFTIKEKRGEEVYPEKECVKTVRKERDGTEREKRAGVGIGWRVGSNLSRKDPPRVC